jgi:fatty acid/phospholipid biosynthesis enzyme
MIMHGRSDRRAMANALKVSAQFVHADVNRQIGDALNIDAQNGGTPGAAS